MDDQNGPVEPDAELRSLRAQVAELQSRLAAVDQQPQREPRRRRSSVRWTVAVLVMALGALLAIPAVTGLWAKRTLLDTDHYVATVAPLASDPAIQAIVADRISTAIFDHVDVETLTRQTLGALADRGAPTEVTALAGPITSGIHSFVEGRVLDLVASPTFQTAWVQANRIAHAQAVDALTGKDSSVTATSDGLSVDLGPFLEKIKADLVQRGFTLADRIPAVNVQVQVLRGVDLASVERGVNALDAVGTWLPWIAIAVLAGGVLIAPRRRTGALVAGFGLAGAMVVLVIAIAVLRSWMVGRMSDSGIPVAAGRDITGDLTYYLRASARTTFALGLVVVLFAWATGSTPGTQRVRRGVAGFTQGVRSRLTGSASPSVPERWVAGHRLLVNGGVTLAGAALVLSWNTVRAGPLVVVSLVVLALIALVQSLDTKPPDPALADDAK